MQQKKGDKIKLSCYGKDHHDDSSRDRHTLFVGLQSNILSVTGKERILHREVLIVKQLATLQTGYWDGENIFIGPNPNNY
jgi:hypothetical protein